MMILTKLNYLYQKDINQKNLEKNLLNKAMNLNLEALRIKNHIAPFRHAQITDSPTSRMKRNEP